MQFFDIYAAWSHLCTTSACLVQQKKFYSAKITDIVQWENLQGDSVYDTIFASHILNRPEAQTLHILLPYNDAVIFMHVNIIQFKGTYLCTLYNLASIRNLNIRNAVKWLWSSQNKDIPVHRRSTQWYKLSPFLYANICSLLVKAGAASCHLQHVYRPVHAISWQLLPEHVA